MSIEKDVRLMLRDIGLDAAKRKFLKLVLGEFNRVNDGALINDEKACKVLKKMIKSNIEMITLVDDVEVIALEGENRIMTELMPVEDIATELDMLEAMRSSVPERVKIDMSMMKPIMQCLEDRGFTVDKRALSMLLKSLT